MGESRLRHVHDRQPGIVRLRAGKGFRYVDADGATVRDRQTLQRIRQLAIPPAYKDVWICASADGHLQATGRDARGRKQYRYTRTGCGGVVRTSSIASWRSGRHCRHCAGRCVGTWH